MKLRQGISMTLGGSLGVMAIFGFVMLMLSVLPAKAADKGGPDFLEQIPQASTSSPWSGCWIGAGIGMMNGMVSGGGPIGLAADGHKASGHGGCRIQAGALVGGVEASYGHMFGDLDTIGIDRELAVTGTLGVAVLSRAQLYGHVTWAQLDTPAGDIDGWKFGPGVAIQMPNSPLEIDFRYSYGVWDVGSIAPGLDANSHEFMALVKYRFGAK